MIEAFVDGNTLDPRALAMHQQNEPFPGGSKYSLRIVDDELAAVVRQKWPLANEQTLTPRQTTSLFNIVRPLISMRLGRTEALFWANTIERLNIDTNAIEICGVCSPNVRHM